VRTGVAGLATPSSRQTLLKKPFQIGNPGNKKFWIISNLVETNMDFLSEKFLLSLGSANRETCIAQWSPARAKKHSPRQKRRWFLFSKCGLPPFQPGDPFATASLCGNKARGV
jgi:hypothetical protein